MWQQKIEREKLILLTKKIVKIGLYGFCGLTSLRGELHCEIQRLFNTMGFLR